MPPAVVMEPERKKRRRPRCARDEAVAVKIARWSEQNSQLPENDRKCSSQMQAKGSTKGCMKGKGGPENENCRSRGVRQRKWGKWVAEIRLPSGRGRMWLGTYATEAEAAVAYDNAAAAMYGPCARLNAPQGEGNGDPATSPTLPGDHGDPTPCLSALPPEHHGDPTFCFTLPEESGYPANCLTPYEEHGVSTSYLTQPEGHCDPACLSASEVYGDPTACLTLPGLHGDLTAYPTGDAAHFGPPDQFHRYQACLGLPEFYGDPAHQNAYPTYLSGPEVCDDPHLILPELHDDPTYFSVDELCGGPACVELLEDDGGSVSVTAPQGGSGDHAHVASTTGPSAFITSSHEDVGGPSTGVRMEHPQADQINKTIDNDQRWPTGTPTNVEELENFECEDWLEDFSSDFCLEDFLPEMKDE